MAIPQCGHSTNLIIAQNLKKCKHYGLEQGKMLYFWRQYVKISE